MSFIKPLDCKLSIRTNSVERNDSVSSILGLRDDAWVPPMRLLSGLFPFRHKDANAGRHDRRVVWNVVLVPQEQLQCVRSWLKGNFRFGLASAKVEMIEVIGNRLI